MATDKSAPSDAEAAEQKRFRIMAGAGLLVVLTLAYFALTLGSDDDAGVTTAEPAADSTAAVEEVPVEPVAEAPLPPGVSGGGGGGGGGLGGGGGSVGGGGGSTVPAGADRKAVEEHYVSRGIPARAAAAFADSAARRGGSSARAAPPANGRARVARATSIMVQPGSGSSALTVPTGSEVRLSGCEAHGSETWCRASVSGISGWVRQSDVSGGS